MAAARPIERARQIEGWSGSITPSVAQVDARVIVEVIGNDVDTGLKTGAAERCVAGLLVQVVGSEDQ